MKHTTITLTVASAPASKAPSRPGPYPQVYTIAEIVNRGSLTS